MTDNRLKKIGKYLADYAVSNGKNTFYVDYSGSKEDTVSIQCCVEATKEHGGLFVVAVCCGWDTSNHIAMKRKSLDEIEYKGIRSIHSLNWDSISKIMNTPDQDSFCSGLFGLVTSEKASASGIVVGSLDRTFGKYIRDYYKRSGGACDIYPLYNMNYSEIVSIADSLWGDKDIEWAKPRPLKIAQEYEHAISLMNQYNMWKEPPHTHGFWKYLTHAQKKDIAYIFENYKETEHKSIDHKPHFKDA